MTDVWCVVGGGDGRDRYLAEGLIRAGNTVAVLKHDVAQLAMLVNGYGDAMLSIEVRDAEQETLEEALRNVQQSFGHVDSIAVILEPWEDGLGEDKRSPRRLAPGGSDFARAVPPYSRLASVKSGDHHGRNGFERRRPINVWDAERSTREPASPGCLRPTRQSGCRGA